MGTSNDCFWLGGRMISESRKRLIYNRIPHEWQRGLVNSDMALEGWSQLLDAGHTVTHISCSSYARLEVYSFMVMLNGLFGEWAKALAALRGYRAGLALVGG